MAVGGDLSDINTELETLRAAILAHNAATSNTHHHPVHLECRDVVETTAIEDRSIIFTLADDVRVRGLLFQAYSASGTQAGKAKLEAVTDAGLSIARLLPGAALEVTVTGIGTGALAQDRARYPIDVAPVVSLLAGVPYRLSVETTPNGGTATLALARATLVVGIHSRR